MSHQLFYAAVLLVLLNLSLHGTVLRAQEPSGSGEESWNSLEVRELIARARAARETLAASGDLQTYEARTEGHVYFFIDPERGERYLIRIDQVAAELRWEAPDRLRQRIVGERSETRLPVRNFDYYLDRLTLVPHGFEDEIRIGSGLDVSGVLHPLAQALPEGPEAEIYDFRLGESLSLLVAGRVEPVRIQEIVVRPRDPSRPGILGTIHLDQASASIVRMAFTFTTASYVDPRNDRISVELDYGLWDGRYWLPNVQKIEVRREIPSLDLGIGTVIRTVLQVHDYLLDAPFSESLPAIPRVTFVPLEVRRSYSFSKGLYADMAEDGLGELVVDADPRELQSRAMELLGTVPPSGLSPVRLHFPGFSSALRYGRAEGLRIGIGGSVQPQPGLRVRGNAGYAISNARVQADLTLKDRLSPKWTLGLRIRARDLDDLGLSAGSAPLISSLGAVVRGEDYLDPFWVTGGGVSLEHQTDEASQVSFAMSIESHSSASLELDSSPLKGSQVFRPIREVSSTEFVRFDMRLGRSISWPIGRLGWGEIDAMFLYGQKGDGLGISASLDQLWGPDAPTRELRLRAKGWTWLGDPLPQGHRLLGGRGTVPGFAYREFVGESSIAASLTGSMDVWGPLVRLRSGIHAGWSDGGNPQIAERWNAKGTNGIRTSVSIGVGLGWDLLHLDLARGFGGGEWQLLLSLDRRWWNHL